MAAGGVWTASTGRGRGILVLGVVLLVAGLAWHYPLVTGLGGCLTALVLAELVAVLAARRVEIHRTVEPRVVLRQGRCDGRLVVRGRRRRGLVRLDVADRVGRALVPVPLPERNDPDHPGGEAVYPIPTPRRGLITVGPVQVRLAGLTGMAARSIEAGSLDEVRVLPRQIPIGTLMAGHRRAVSGGDDSLEVGGTDLVGLHEYGMGDDLRRLHWATSARSGTLMVREDAEPSEPHVCVILDDRAASYLGDADLFEEAVELVAALCRTAAEAGHPLRLHTGSGRHEVVVPGSATRQPRREQRDVDWLLAEIELTGSLGRSDLDMRDLDVAVAVTGPGSDLRELGLSLGSAPTRVLAVADPSPLVGAHQESGILVLRGATSSSLAMLWDQAARP